jgi:hypothetical protein
MTSLIITGVYQGRANNSRCRCKVIIYYQILKRQNYFDYVTFLLWQWIKRPI